MAAARKPKTQNRKLAPTPTSRNSNPALATATGNWHPSPGTSSSPGHRVCHSLPGWLASQLPGLPCLTACLVGFLCWLGWGSAVRWLPLLPPLPLPFLSPLSFPLPLWTKVSLLLCCPAAAVMPRLVVSNYHLPLLRAPSPFAPLPPCSIKPTATTICLFWPTLKWLRNSVEKANWKLFPSSRARHFD